MKAFLSISYHEKDKLQKEIAVVETELKSHLFETLVFVKKYQFANNQTKEMMQLAFQELQTCDVFLAEISDKAMGVGIEAGLAYALNIPVIYFRKKHKPDSTTMNGIAMYEFEYESIEDLKIGIKTALTKISE